MALSWVANATGQVAKMEKYTTILQQLFNLDLDTFLAMPDISTLDVQARSALIEIAVLQSRTALDHFDFPLVERIANRVLPYLVPEHDNDPFLFNKPSHLRPPLVYMLGFYNQLIGNLDVAAHMLSDAAESAAALYNIHIIALALGQSGQVNLARGALYQAEIDFQKSIDAVQAAPEMPTAYVSQAWYGLACLAYEWNDLQQVEIFIQNALETGKRWQSYELIFPAYMLLARRYALAEDWTRVHENLRLMQQMPPEFLKSTGAFLDHFQAWVEFRQGRPERLQHWVDGFTPAEFTPTPFVQEMEAISAARLLMALGRIDQGIQLLEPFLSALQNSSRRGRLVEALVVKSMLLAAQNKAVEAQTVLAQALEIAQPQHYVRLFVDEGESMQRLLEKYIPTLSGDMKAYAQSILHAFPQAAPPLPASHPNMEGLVDALSEREIEVLNLMVSGISNAEMASRLFVSVNTVKKHITNIFNKLGVKNRLQAIKQGRQLGLIES
jgi:LuxR family maltose regulon positive regulatory protein